MLIDSHCHLEQVDDPDAAVAEALQAGVGRLVAVAEDGASVRRILELKRRHPAHVLAGVGFHPMFTPHRPQAEVEADLALVEAALPEADVMGEIGLDYKHAVTDEQKDWQRQILQRQLEMAERARLPVNLHSRRAERDTMEIAIQFTQRTGLGAQLHWFTHSRKLVRRCNEAGVYISAGPSLLGSEETRAVVATIDRRLLLLETDSPVPFDGEPARPAWVARVAGAVAALWGCTPAEVAEVTGANFRRYSSRYQ